MKLYGFPFSGNARRVHMLCEELGIPYTYENIDLREGQQQSPEFKRLNPNTKVPAIDDDGFVLWESQTIMRYLANKHKANDWYPVELQARARVDQWLDWNQTRFSSEVGKIAFNTLFAGDKADKKAIEDGKQALTKILPILEEVLSKQPYICGPRPTLPDLSVTSFMVYLEMCKFDLSPYPAIGKWFATMKQRPSFAKTAPK